MCAAKTNWSTELQYIVPKRHILQAYTCLIEFCECQQGHRKQRNLTDVLHAEQWSAAMLYPYLLKWNIFPTWFFYSASSCSHIVTNRWAVPVWLIRPVHRTGNPNSPPGNEGLTAHKGHWAQVPGKLTRAAISVLLKWLSTFPYLPPQTVVTSSCSVSLEENVLPGFAELTTLLWTDRLLLLVKAKIR